MILILLKALQSTAYAFSACEVEKINIIDFKIAESSKSCW